MITPVERNKIINSLKVLTSDIYERLSHRKIGICRDKNLLGIYLSKNIDSNNKFKKGIYKGYRFEIVSIGDRKIPYVIRVLNGMNDETKAYGVLVNTRKYIGVMIIEDYENNLKYTMADKISLDKPIAITESLTPNIDDLEKERQNHNRELLVNDVNLKMNKPIQSNNEAIKNTKIALLRVNSDKFKNTFGKHFFNKFEDIFNEKNCCVNIAKVFVYLFSNLERMETLYTDDRDELTILIISGSIYLVLLTKDTYEVSLIRLIDVDGKNISKEFVMLLGLKEFDGKIKIKRVVIKDGNISIGDDLEKILTENMKL